MTLANLTASGWVLFALTLMIDLKFLVEVSLVLRHRPGRGVTIDVIGPALLTVWLLWLVTP